MCDLYTIILHVFTDDFLQQAQKPQKKPEVVYAEVKQSTNPPAAPPPTQPVVYADIQQSTNPPAAPPPTHPVQHCKVRQLYCYGCYHSSVISF